MNRLYLGVSKFKFSVFHQFGNHKGKFTGTDRNGPNYRIGPLRDLTARAVHSCNSWLKRFCG